MARNKADRVISAALKTVGCKAGRSSVAVQDSHCLGSSWLLASLFLYKGKKEGEKNRENERNEGNERGRKTRFSRNPSRSSTALYFYFSL
jgi:hypothetical protein